MEGRRSEVVEVGFSEDVEGVAGPAKRTKGKLLMATVLAAFLIVATVVAVGALVLALDSDGGDDDAAEKPLWETSNLIFMISDGYGPTSVTFARLLNDDKALEFDSWIAGASRTRSANSFVTDSAAGATAFSCSMRTYNDAIAVLPAPDAGNEGPDPAFNRTSQPLPCATMMEAAKMLGMKCGAVVTSRITHATPAAFLAHMSYRDYEYEIAEQVARGMEWDVLLGGGRSKFDGRPDNVSLTEEMEQRGYQYIRTRDELLDVQSLKMPLVGLFAEGHMAYDIDRRNDPALQQEEPTLEEMVEVALELLAADGEPFFLLIEGSKIDLASHQHDAAAHWREIEMYQRAGAAVRRFREERAPNTLVVSTSDHETGGFALGVGTKDFQYPVYEVRLDVLRSINASNDRMASLIGQEGSDARATILQYTGLNITDPYLREVQFAFQNATDDRFRPISIGDFVAQQARVAYTTPGHTGVDVPLYTLGFQQWADAAGKPNPLLGVLENFRIGAAVAEMFEFDVLMEEHSLVLQAMDWNFPLDPDAPDDQDLPYDDDDMPADPSDQSRKLHHHYFGHD